MPIDLAYKYLMKPLLFRMDAEQAHHKAMHLWNKYDWLPISKMLSYRNAKLERNIDGLNFKNPIGLAAGFDKDGKYFELMSRLGFGFIEIGTVTPKPQIGNPRPRLFRLPKDEALINRMGFNNDGVEALVRRLEKGRTDPNVILGINIGKNKVTPNQHATQDYQYCVKHLAAFADYFTVNVSSPNTPGLRELQNKGALSSILKTCQDANEMRRPIYLKIAPDLHTDQILEIIEIVDRIGINGVISNNTSVRREGLHTEQGQIDNIGAGGLSGRPIHQQSDQILSFLLENKPEGMTVVASGGVHSVEVATDKLRAGADLVQVYTGLIYQGPTFVKRIKENVALRL